MKKLTFEEMTRRDRRHARIIWLCSIAFFFGVVALAGFLAVSSLRS